MKLEELVRLVGTEPVFTTGLLISGRVSQKEVRRQLSRWKEAGKVIQLRKGIYALAEPFRSRAAHPFLIANHLVRASYVSLQSALAWYGMIPENVPVTTSVTTLRPWSWNTPLGVFAYRHIKTGFFHSFVPIEVSPGSVAMLATREKALCDLIHLTPGADTEAWLRELRLQDLDQLDMTALRTLVQSSGSPKLERARRLIETLRKTAGP
jgi:predicted transcriptional regulator of viral defense system